VAGPPNSGKSSLINAIVGEERAIVTDVPGTTRDHLDVPLSIGGIPVRLTDTAGLHETEDRVEAIGIKRARQLVERADVLVWLGPRAETPQHLRLVRVQSKCDLPAPLATDDAIAVSAITGTGVHDLLARIATLGKQILPDDGAVALNRRQAELIGDVAEALREAAAAIDPAICAELLRRARASFDRLTGRAGVNDMLDALFSRFCLGK